MLFTNSLGLQDAEKRNLIHIGEVQFIPC